MSSFADVAVIGLGSGGENLASSLASAGKRVVGFEPARVGGECPFTACMPSKALLHDAAAGVGWRAATTHRDEVIEHLDDSEHAAELEASGVRLVRQAARLVDERVVESEGGERWRADHVVLATGADPVVPPIEGLDEGRVWTSEDLLMADSLPESLLVLGGGPVGCELATIASGFGGEVTLVEMADLLGGSVDPTVAALLAAELRSAGIDVRTRTQVTAVDHGEQGVSAELDTGARIEAQVLLVATGTAPRWDGLGLEDIGLRADGAPIVDRNYQVGGLEWLRAIGDLNGRSPWTHGANHEAERLGRLLLGVAPGPVVTDMAHCVFTDPPVAAIGTTAEAAAGAGRAVVVGTARYADIARTSTDELGAGAVVVVADADTGELLGCSGIGERFDEVIATVAALRHCRADIEHAADLVLAFPTVAQVLTPAFRDAVDARTHGGVRSV